MAGRIELVADQRGLRDQSVADLTRQSIERNPSFLFAMDYRYDKTLFYEWLADRRTPTKELGRLAKDLGTPIPVLLFGEQEAKAPQNPTPRRPKKNS